MSEGIVLDEPSVSEMFEAHKFGLSLNDMTASREKTRKNLLLSWF